MRICHKCELICKVCDGPVHENGYVVKQIIPYTVRKIKIVYFNDDDTIFHTEPDIIVLTNDGAVYFSEISEDGAPDPRSNQNFVCYWDAEHLPTFEALKDEILKIKERQKEKSKLRRAK